MTTESTSIKTCGIDDSCYRCDRYLDCFLIDHKDKTAKWFRAHRCDNWRTTPELLDVARGGEGHTAKEVMETGETMCFVLVFLVLFIVLFYVLFCLIGGC